RRNPAPAGARSATRPAPDRSTPAWPCAAGRSGRCHMAAIPPIRTGRGCGLRPAARAARRRHRGQAGSCAARACVPAPGRPGAVSAAWSAAAAALGRAAAPGCRLRGIRASASAGSSRGTRGQLTLSSRQPRIGDTTEGDMDRIRMMLALACLGAALAAGLWLSGLLVLKLLGIGGAAVGWTTYLDYLRAIAHPQVAPHAGRIRLAGGLGMGLPLLAASVPAFVLLRPARRAMHGRARFANVVDLLRRGLFTRSGHGIVVGRWCGRLLRLDGQQSVLLAAPTRSGKGVGVVVPNLLEYRGSVVVLDIKQENFALTSGWREAQGQAVYLFNPFAEDRRTHRWNPLSYVSTGPLQRVSDLQGIATLLYPDAGPEQKFWTSQ